MIELLVPYKRDFEERENNKRSFLAHYADYEINVLEDYSERAVAYNQSARESMSKYIALADIDAIIPHSQMSQGVEMLEQGYDLVYPFSRVVNLHPDGTLTDDWPRHWLRGLMVLMPRDKFLAFGGDNEQFIGYGWDDEERYYRALNSNYKVGRVDGVCQHLTHPRTGFKNPHFYYNMRLMNKEKQKWTKNQSL